MIVIIKDFLHSQIFFLCRKKTCHQRFRSFKSNNKSGIIKLIRKITPDLYISIEIYTSIVIYNIYPNIITNKRIFSCLICLFCKTMIFQIKVFFIPLNNFIIWHIFLPSRNTLFYKISLTFITKPTIMN